MQAHHAQRSSWLETYLFVLCVNWRGIVVEEIRVIALLLFTAMIWDISSSSQETGKALVQFCIQKRKQHSLIKTSESHPALCTQASGTGLKPSDIKPRKFLLVPRLLIPSRFWRSNCLRPTLISVNFISVKLILSYFNIKDGILNVLRLYICCLNAIILCLFWEFIDLGILNVNPEHHKP